MLAACRLPVPLSFVGCFLAPNIHHDTPCYPCACACACQIYPIGIPLLYAWQLFKHRHRIYPKQALRDGVSPERRLGDKKIAHTVVLWEVRGPRHRVLAGYFTTCVNYLIVCIIIRWGYVMCGWYRMYVCR